MDKSIDHDKGETNDETNPEKVEYTGCNVDAGFNLICYNLSHELALFLKEMGFSNVKVLVNSWTV